MSNKKNVIFADQIIVMRSLFVVILFFIISVAVAQHSVLYSQSLTQPQFKDSLVLSPWNKVYQTTNVGIPLLLSATAVSLTNHDERFRDLRNNFVPNYSYSFADYLQYLPGAVVLGLKTFGVEGNSSWPKMLTADALSVAITAVTVIGLKYTAKIERPDGSTRNSFPSGHTATAFMCATMLHIEYGDISPWISVGGYAAASAVGVSRIMSNRHWLSDVMAGAFIGIVSTEVGYIISDAIFKKSEPSFQYRTVPYDIFDNQSFVGIGFGFFNPLDYENAINDNSLSFGLGSRASIEGAGFFNNTFVGIGGRMTAFSSPVFVNDIRQNNSLHGFSFDCGPYFYYSFAQNWQLSGKLMSGLVRYKTSEVGENITIGDNKLKLSYGLGTSVRYKIKDNFGFRLYAEYDMMPTITNRTEAHLHTFTYGSCFEIEF